MKNPRLGAVAALAVLSLWGCPCGEPPPPEPECGDLQSFDLTGCERGTLGILYTGGIWNARLTWSSGGSSLAAISMAALGGEMINGRPVRSKQLTGNTFYVAASFEESGAAQRLAFAACRAESTVHMTGKVQWCAGGQKADEGAFEARYLDWGSGETSAVNVDLVGEAPVGQGTAADVWVQGGFAYVPALAGGLAVFDVHDPAAPALVTTVPADAEDSWSDAKGMGSTLYVASRRHGVLVYDVANPAAPVKLRQVPVDDLDVRTLQLDLATGRLFAHSPGPAGEVLVFNVQAPATPELRFRIRAAQASPVAGRWPHDSAFFAGRLYVNHGLQGVVAFDVPPEPPGTSTPLERGAMAGAAGAVSHAGQVGSFGGRTVVFEGGEGWGAHLRAVDFTDPLAPVELGEWSTRQPEISIHRMALLGTKLYVAHHQSGLRVLDVSDPSAPVQRGYYNTWRPLDPGRGRGFFDGAAGVRAPGDGYIYVAEASRGLMIFRDTGP